jgi:uncharacterized protein (TIGR02266 family)
MGKKSKKKRAKASKASPQSAASVRPSEVAATRAPPDAPTSQDAQDVPIKRNVPVQRSVSGVVPAQDVSHQPTVSEVVPAHDAAIVLRVPLDPLPDLAALAAAELASNDDETARSSKLRLDESRATSRVAVSVDIHFTSESHFFTGLSGDISEGGLFLSTYRPLSIGSEVEVEFSLPASDRTVVARGKVRWLREHSEDHPRGVGISFEELSDEDRERIHAFCSRRPPLYYEDVG